VGSAPNCPTCGRPIPEPDAIRLGELIEKYLGEKEKTQTLTAKTLGEYRADLETFLEVVGDIPADQVGFTTARDFKDVLLNLPANRRKNPAFRGRSARALAATDTPTASITTIQHGISRVSGLLSWAKANGYVDANPMEGIGRTIGRREKPSWSDRERFSEADLSLIFGHALLSQTLRLKRKHGAAFYWVPILALFTGARLNELAQLHCEDVQKVEGIWTVNINDDTPDKRLKNQSSRRMVPLAETILELGFLDYWANQVDAHERLFPTLPHGRDGYGRYVSKWFNEDYLPMLGIKVERKAFHSLRHTVADVLKQSGVLYEHAAEYLGHAQNTETFGRYGKRFRPGVLHAECCQFLRFEFIAWENLRASW
jgi:integrase